jgi:hypothetical protein
MFPDASTVGQLFVCVLIHQPMASQPYPVIQYTMVSVIGMPATASRSANRPCHFHTLV